MSPQAHADSSDHVSVTAFIPLGPCPRNHITRKAFLAWRVIWVHRKFDFWSEQIICTVNTLQTWKSRGSHYRIQRNLAWTSLNILPIGGLHRSSNAIGLGMATDLSKVGMLTRQFDFRPKTMIFVDNYRSERFVNACVAFSGPTDAERYNHLSERQIFDRIRSEIRSETWTSTQFSILGEKCEIISDSRGSFLSRFRFDLTIFGLSEIFRPNTLRMIRRMCFFDENILKYDVTKALRVIRAVTKGWQFTARLKSRASHYRI